MGCNGCGRARPSEAGRCAWGADSVYCSAQIEARLPAKGLQSRIHRRAARNPSAFTAPEAANTTRSKVRARVEHFFGQQQNSIGAKIARSVCIARARFKIGM